MKSRIIWVVVVLVAGYVAVKVGSILTTRASLAGRVEYRLDFVDETSVATVKQDLVHDAKKLGVALTPADIEIAYEDTAVESVAQRMVGRTGMQFRNKRVNIRVRYQAGVLGVSWPQDITRSKIRQVSARAPERQREAQRVLDDAP